MQQKFLTIFYFFDVTKATFFQFKSDSETTFRLKINLSFKSNIAKLAPVERFLRNKLLLTLGVELIKLAKQAKIQEYRKNINASAG